jgi:hypothetical protein
MDRSAATELPSREEVLEAMAEVMERQAKVARAEAALGTARRRLQDAIARLAGLTRARGEEASLPPLPGVTLDLAARPSHALTLGEASASGLPSRPQVEPSLPPNDADDDERQGTLRQRILTVMAASPAQVYTPALLAPAVGSRNRDSIRNTLLVLAAKGKIEKVGTGQYRAGP